MCGFHERARAWLRVAAELLSVGIRTPDLLSNLLRFCCRKSRTDERFTLTEINQSKRAARFPDGISHVGATVVQ